MNDYGTSPAGSAGQNSTLENWLYLRHTTGIGELSLHSLLAAFGSVDAIINASQRQLREAGASTRVINALLQEPKPDISADLEWYRKHHQHHIITLFDSSYPEQLKQLPDAPPILYVRGDPDYLMQPMLAMVGTRNPTAAGRNTAKEFASYLSSAGITIVSGLASGIDGASHEGALQRMAGTVAVVAHGLDIVYPAHHQKLAQQIAEQGAVISEMPIGTQPARGLFPRRNRIISALSLGTLVVEAAQKSGSLITARYASEQNREVFAIPGSIHNPMARGCHRLIRQGAKLVETAEDILEELSFPLKETASGQRESEKKATDNPKEPCQTLDPDHQKLLKCLAYEPASIDELVSRSDFSAAEVASMLLILELEGIIVCQDGHYTCIS